MSQTNQPVGTAPVLYAQSVAYPSISSVGEPPPPYTPRGQYHPPHGQYPPAGQFPSPGPQYPPSASPGRYPSPGATGQYPPYGAPGQYMPPSAPEQYMPPSGQYPPSAAPAQYPPSGQYPPAGATTPHVPPPFTDIGPQGYDTVDSDSEDRICTKNSKHPMQVKFVNRSNQKVNILWIDEDGIFEKITSLKPNISKDVDTWETHPFIAESKKEVVINGNVVFFPQKIPGGHGNVKAEITEGPKDLHSLRSSPSGHPVTLKFSNRTDVHVTVKWIDINGQPQNIKVIAPKKAWVFNSCEGHYFIARERDRDEDEVELNRGWFYLVKRGPIPQTVTKVLITGPD